jgi:3-dehydrosphinganine reductase
MLAFITGGSEGIGKEIARAFLRKGTDVVILSRSEQKLKAAVSDLEKDKSSPNVKLEYKSLDVTDWPSTESTINSLIEKFGTPDYVVNCAGSARPGYIDQLEVEHYRNMMDLNYFGVMHVCKAVVPHLLRVKKGRITNVSSMAGFIGLFGYTGYCASKYAVVGFSEALRRELSPFGITVSVLCPPNTRTPGLLEENKYKPAEVLKTEEKAKPVDPDVVANEFMRTLNSRKFMIVPTFDGTMAYFLSRYSPSVLNQFVKRPTQ